MTKITLESTENTVLIIRRNGESERVSVTAPMLNINGASGEMLLHEQQEVLTALNTLGRFLRAAAPHGRDFQTDSTGTKYDMARSEFEREWEFITEMELRHTEIARQIHNQLHRRG